MGIPRRDFLQIALSALAYPGLAGRPRLLAGSFTTCGRTFFESARALVPHREVPELMLIRDRMIRALGPADDAAAQNIARVASRLADSLCPDGRWPDIDYGDQS